MSAPVGAPVGETERALRALTCRECANGTPLYDAKHHHGRGAASVLPCTYNPKLLPLFNAAVEQATENARLEQNEAFELAALSGKSDFPVNSPVWCAALHDVIALHKGIAGAIAGAYAAAAKLCDAYGREGDRRAQEYACETADEIAARIRALTPADARQAQPSGERMACGHLKEDLVYEGVACCDCGYNGEDETPCSKRDDGVHCEHWWDGVEERCRTCAAIASAEARARLEAQWKCRANPTSDPPQDCGWPSCGCDPHADKVIAALQESGHLPCDPNDNVSEAQFQKAIWDAIASVLGPKGQILANSLQEKLTIGIRDYLRWNSERAKAHREKNEQAS